MRQDLTIWEAGYRDALDGKASNSPRGLDRLLYAAGQIEGAAARNWAARQARQFNDECEKDSESYMPIPSYAYRDFRNWYHTPCCETGIGVLDNHSGSFECPICLKRLEQFQQKIWLPRDSGQELRPTQEKK